MKGRVHATQKDIRDSINANPGRFGLSIATISIGVFSLSILISVLNGLEKQSEAVIQNLGVNVIGILAWNCGSVCRGPFSPEVEPSRHRSRTATC